MKRFPSIRKKIKNHLFEVILVGVLAIGCAVARGVLALINKPAATSASVYLRNEVLLKIDLSPSLGTDTFLIHGAHGDMLIERVGEKVRVKESSCPNQNCVHQGFLDKEGGSIVCAYNEVSVVLSGNIGEISL